MVKSVSALTAIAPIREVAAHQVMLDRRLTMMNPPKLNPPKKCVRNEAFRAACNRRRVAPVARLVVVRRLTFSRRLLPTPAGAPKRPLEHRTRISYRGNSNRSKYLAVSLRLDSSWRRGAWMSEHDCMAISPHGLGVTVCAVPRGPVIRLNWILPRSLWRRISRHRTFLCAHGPLFVPDLWEAVVQRDLSTDPVREFLAPEQVVSDTRLCWSGGMPRDFVGVA